MATVTPDLATALTLAHRMRIESIERSIRRLEAVEHFVAAELASARTELAMAVEAKERALKEATS